MFLQAMFCRHNLTIWIGVTSMSNDRFFEKIDVLSLCYQTMYLNFIFDPGNKYDKSQALGEKDT